MATRILISCLIFLFTGVSGIALAPNAAGAEPYSARACARIYQRIRYIESDIKSYQTIMNRLGRELASINSKLNSIQIKRRRIGCLFQSRLDRTEMRVCRRLTKQRMKYLRIKDSIRNKDIRTIREYNKTVRARHAISNIESRCKDARHKRSRRIIERQGNNQQMRHNRANSDAGIAVIRGIGAAIQKRINRKKSRRKPSTRRKCHRNPKTGVIDCGSN